MSWCIHPTSLDFRVSQALTYARIPDPEVRLLYAIARATVKGGGAG